MKKIKVKFVDFWSGYIPEKRSIYQELSKKYEVELSDKPDYLFYGCFGYEHLDYNCIRIFVATECIEPDFNVCDYAIGYSKLSYGDRYLYFPASYESGYKVSCETMLNKRSVTMEELKEKNGFCAIVVSNGLSADQSREKLFEVLSRYKTVDSGGRYRNNVGGPVKDKNEFQSKYKFTIASENVSSPGYVTEKIIESFAARTIPIYWGDPLVDEIYNPKAFINCMNYESFDDVLAEVIRLDKDDQAYLTMVNEHAVVDVSAWNYEERQRVLLDFLSNIFNKDIESARKVSHQAANKQYNNLMRDWRNTYKCSFLRVKRRIESIKLRKYWH